LVLEFPLSQWHLENASTCPGLVTFPIVVVGGGGGVLHH